MKLVRSFRRAAAIGIALAVVPATIALASPSQSAKSATPAATSGSALASIYPFGDKCALRAPTATFHGNATSGTWTLAPKLTCNHLKTRIAIVAVLHKAGRAQMGSAGRCVVGLDVQVCRTAAGPTRQLKVSGSGMHGHWSTIVSYQLQGPDAWLWFSGHRGNCKWEAQSISALCRYVVDKRTL